MGVDVKLLFDILLLMMESLLSFVEVCNSAWDFLVVTSFSTGASRSET